jgi:SAM-dependent methyltransferase
MSRAVLEEHRRVWRDKPILDGIYRVWFDLLAAEVPPRGCALEVGSGPGFLRSHLRRHRPDVRFVASDLLPTPWNDLAADCLHLPLRSGALDAVIGLDALHHFARPGRFFAEVSRVLKPGGRLAMIEPWVTPFSYPIYRFLHQEGCTLGLDPWDPFALGGGSGKEAFDGDAAVTWRLLRTTSPARWGDLGLDPPRYRALNGFAYLLSLGFKTGSLLPPSFLPRFLALDRWLSPLAPGVGLRAFVVWTKPHSPTPPPPRSAPGE